MPVQMNFEEYKEYVESENRKQEVDDFFLYFKYCWQAIISNSQEILDNNCCCRK